MSKRAYIKILSYGALVMFLFLVPLFITGNYLLHIIIMSGISIIMASSLRLIYTSGLLSLGHGGVMSVGAYTSTILVMKLGVSSWVAMGVGGVAAAALALIVGYPFVRLKGAYFSMCTIFFAECIRFIIERWRNVTGGSTGIYNIPRPDPIVIPGLLNMDFHSKVDFYYLLLILVLLTLLILYGLDRSRTGLTWHSISQSDFLAESIGVNTAQFKVLAFCIGCFFAGVSGSFYSQYIRAIIPSAFGFIYAIYVVVYMIVGGSRMFAGPIFGALILTFAPESVRMLKEFQPFIFAGILLMVIFFLPEGVVSIPQRLKQFSRERGSHA